MTMPTECEECKQPHDFEKKASGSCSTCGKQYLCLACCGIHECVAGKIRHLRIISNPKWIVNLVSIN